MIHFMPQYMSLDPSERIPAIDSFFSIKENFNADQIAAKIYAMHAETQLDVEQMRLGWMHRSVEEFSLSEDPFIRLAVALYACDDCFLLGSA